MIPVKLHEGKLVDKYGKLIEPNENGLVEIEIEGKMKRFVPEKLIDYLVRKGQVYKEPILRRNKPSKKKSKVLPKSKPKKGNRGHNRRKRIVVSKDGIIVEFESITKASIELKICRSKIFAVLNGKIKTLKGYKIKYAA
jgi:hypothetical protein